MEKLFLTLFISLFISISSRTYLEKRHQLAENLKNFIAQNEKQKMPAYINEISKLYKTTRVLFYGIEKGKVDYIKKKFGLSDKIIHDIKIAPYASSGIGTIYDEYMNNLSGDLSGQYNEFRWCLGTTFVEDDITYFLLIELKAHADLDLNGNVIWYEECRGSFIWKECWQNRRVENVPYSPEQQQRIISFVQYQMFKTITEHITYIENDNIQAYISENNVINSDDDKAVIFIGSFGDIAIGPKKYLSSIQPVNKVHTFSQGHSTDCINGPYDSFCNDKDRTDISCKKVYGGLFVHKFNMLLGRVNPTSSMEAHRTQMENNEKNGPYALVLYSDGQLEFRTSKSNINQPVLWTTNTQGQGEAPYEIIVTSNYKLQLIDKNGKLIYQTKDYINIPSIRYGGIMQNAEYLDRYNGYQGGRYHGGVMGALRMGIDDEDFPNLFVSYSVWSGSRWVTNTKPMHNIGGTRKYYPYSILARLTGQGSEKYKICYKVSIRNQKDKTRNRESQFVCNGAQTEWADFEAVSDYISGFEVLILTANDNKIE